MANKKKNNKSKINIYWFYASIVFFIISIGLLGGDNGIQNTQPTDISSFENYLRNGCLLYTSPSPRDTALSRMPSSA